MLYRHAGLLYEFFLFDKFAALHGRLTDFPVRKHVEDEGNKSCGMALQLGYTRFVKTLSKPDLKRAVAIPSLVRRARLNKR